MRTFIVYWRPCWQKFNYEHGLQKNKFFFNTYEYPDHSLMIHKNRFSDNFIARGFEEKHDRLCWDCVDFCYKKEYKTFCSGRERLYLEIDLADNRDWNQYPESTTLNPISVREGSILITTLSNSSSQIERMTNTILGRGYEEFECRIEYPSHEILRYNRGYVYYEKFSKYS